MGKTGDRIETILRERLQPRHLEVRDDSARHAGHAGAASGGGHFDVLIVSEAFEGLSILQQHRLVNEALGDLLGSEIHALALRTVPASSWTGS
jgi:BolA family transcriptional regulator, general stress-responsive regulator